MWRVGFLVGFVVSIALTACSQPEEPTGSTRSSPIVVATGATGTQGGAVARELLERGYRVRALTRNTEQPAAAALRAAGAQVVQGNYDDGDSLRAAMQGAHGVFAVTDSAEHGAPREIDHGRALIYAAEDSGIAHFVFSSVASADENTGIAHFDSKYAIEEMLAESDLAYTVLRPVEFMDNWQRYSRDALRAGDYINPRDGSDMHQWIAASDIGFFVGEAFDNPDEWLGRTEELAGDEMSIDELVQVMSESLGHPVRHVQPEWAEYNANVSEDIATMYRWFATQGYAVNIEALRSRYPDLVRVRDYLETLE